MLLSWTGTAQCFALLCSADEPLCIIPISPLLTLLLLLLTLPCAGCLLGRLLCRWRCMCRMPLTSSQKNGWCWAPRHVAACLPACLPACLACRCRCCSPCSGGLPHLLVHTFTHVQACLPCPPLPCLQRLTELRDRLFCVADTNAAAMEREVRRHHRPAALCRASNHSGGLSPASPARPLPPTPPCCRRMPTGGARGSRRWPSASRRLTSMSRVGGMGGRGVVQELWRRKGCCNTMQHIAMQHQRITMQHDSTQTCSSPLPLLPLQAPFTTTCGSRERQTTRSRCGSTTGAVQTKRYNGTAGLQAGACSSLPTPTPSLRHLHPSLHSSRAGCQPAGITTFRRRCTRCLAARVPISKPQARRPRQHCYIHPAAAREAACRCSAAPSSCLTWAACWLLTGTSCCCWCCCLCCRVLRCSHGGHLL